MPRDDARENRHYLLSDLWRLGRRGDGARHGARSARPRDPLHHVPTAISAAVFPAAHLLPRGRRRAISALRISAVRSRAGRADARGGARAQARSVARALRHSTCDERLDRARDAGANETRHPRPDHPPWNRHHNRRTGPVIPRNHEILHRAVRWPHRRLAVPSARNGACLRLHRL